MERTVVFVHGWSVTHTNTYGHLPERLTREAATHGMSIKVRNVFLGRYISFHDVVRVKDIARAFRKALADECLDQDGRFVCITHSTGGPVIREWWHRYHQPAGSKKCPMSHLIMLAPANYGSALAVLGKGRLSRLKSWFSGVEPGQGVLDWLALGSEPAWKLNEDWIRSKGKHIGPNGVFPFVLTGQTIDRKLYDNLNSYTGELGSDGVVRVAAANLRANYVRLVQQAPVPVPGKKGHHAPALVIDKDATAKAPPTPLRIVAGKSHSGSAKGIMKSVKGVKGAEKDQETVDAIFACMKVRSMANYEAVDEQFAMASRQVQDDERVEVKDRWLLPDNFFIHDQFSMVIFRVTDHEGFPVTDFDLILTAGEKNDPNHLPKGFCQDRQGNPNSRNAVTYYFNYGIMRGCEAVVDPRDPEDVIREAFAGTTALGFRIAARPSSGFAHYLPCEISATPETLEAVIEPNTTTMVDIVLRRVVGEETFRLDQGLKGVNFKKAKPGKPLPD